VPPSVESSNGVGTFVTWINGGTTVIPTTTVAFAMSVALMPLANPVAVIIFVWVSVRVVEHV